MSLTITLEYKPQIAARRDSTVAIANALRTLKATPADESGEPGSFTVPERHRAACFAAASDVGVKIKTRTESAGGIPVVRVTLKP